MVNSLHSLKVINTFIPPSEYLKKVLTKNLLIDNQGNLLFTEEDVQLDSDFHKKFELFMHTKYEIPTLGVSFSLNEIINKLSNLIDEINIVGGAVLHLLSPDFFENCLKKLSINAILDPYLIHKLLNQPNDIDVHLSINSKIPLKEVELVFHNIFNKNHYSTEIVQNYTYNKKIKIANEDSEFLLLGTKTDPSVEFFCVKKIPRDYLFTATSFVLKMDVKKKILPLLHTKIDNFWKTLLHVILMVVDADNIETLNHLAFPMYISYLSRSYISLNANFEKTLVEKFIHDYIIPEAAFGDKFAHIMQNIVKSHHKDRKEILILSYNLFFICKKYLKEDEINKLHSKLVLMIQETNLDLDDSLFWFFETFCLQDGFEQNKNFLSLIYSHKENMDTSKISILKREHCDKKLAFIQFKSLSQNLYLITHKEKENQDEILLSKLNEFIFPNSDFHKIKKEALLNGIIHELTHESIYSFESLLENLDQLLMVENDKITRKVFKLVPELIFFLKNETQLIQFLKIIFKHLHHLNLNEKTFVLKIKKCLPDYEALKLFWTQTLISSNRQFNKETALSLIYSLPAEISLKVLPILLSLPITNTLHYFDEIISGVSEKIKIPFTTELLNYFNNNYENINEIYKEHFLSQLINFNKNLSSLENVLLLPYFKNTNLFLHKLKNDYEKKSKLLKTNIIELFLTTNAIKNFEYQENWAMMFSASLNINPLMTENIWNKAIETSIFNEGINDLKIQKVLFFYFKFAKKKQKMKIMEQILSILIKSEIHEELKEDYINIKSTPEFSRIIKKLKSSLAVERFYFEIIKNEKATYNDIQTIIHYFSIKNHVSSDYLEKAIEKIFEILLDPSNSNLESYKNFYLLFTHEAINRNDKFPQEFFISKCLLAFKVFKTLISNDLIYFILNKTHRYFSKEKSNSSYLLLIKESVEKLLRSNDIELKKFSKIFQKILNEIISTKENDLILNILLLFSNDVSVFSNISLNTLRSSLKSKKIKYLTVEQKYALFAISKPFFKENKFLLNFYKNLFKSLINEIIFNLDIVKIKEVLDIFEKNDLLINFDDLISLDNEKIFFCFDYFNFYDKDLKAAKTIIYHLLNENKISESIYLLEKIYLSNNNFKNKDDEKVLRSIVNAIFVKINLHDKINLVKNLPLENKFDYILNIIEKFLLHNDGQYIQELDLLLNQSSKNDLEKISKDIKKDFVIKSCQSNVQIALNLLENNENYIFPLKKTFEDPNDLSDIFTCISNKILESFNPQLSSSNDENIRKIFNFKKALLNNFMDDQICKLNNILIKKYSQNTSIEHLKILFEIFDENYVNTNNEKIISETFNYLLSKLNLSRKKNVDFIIQINNSNFNYLLVFHLLPNGYLNNTRFSKELKNHMIKIFENHIKNKNEFNFEEHEKYLDSLYSHPALEEISEDFNQIMMSEVISYTFILCNEKFIPSSFTFQKILSYQFKFIEKLNDLNKIHSYFLDMCKLSNFMIEENDLAFFESSFKELIFSFTSRIVKKETGEQFQFDKNQDLFTYFMNLSLFLMSKKFNPVHLYNESLNLMLIYSNHVFIWQENMKFNYDFITLIHSLVEIILKLMPDKILTDVGKILVSKYIRYYFSLNLNDEELKNYENKCNSLWTYLSINNPVKNLNDIEENLINTKILLNSIDYEKEYELVKEKLAEMIDINLNYLITCGTSQANRRFVEITNQHLAWFFNNNKKCNLSRINFTLFMFIKKLSFNEAELLINFDKLIHDKRKNVSEAFHINFNKFYVTFFFANCERIINKITFDDQIPFELFKKQNAIIIKSINYIFNYYNKGLDNEDYNNIFEIWYAYQQNLILKNYILEDKSFYLINIKMFIMSVKKSDFYKDKNLRDLVLNKTYQLICFSKKYNTSIKEESYNEIIKLF